MSSSVPSVCWELEPIRVRMPSAELDALELDPGSQGATVSAFGAFRSTLNDAIAFPASARTLVTVAHALAMNGESEPALRDRLAKKQNNGLIQEKVQVELPGLSLSFDCEVHPEYPEDPDADLVLCTFGGVGEPPFGQSWRIDSDERALGDLVLLSGLENTAATEPNPGLSELLVGESKLESFHDHGAFTRGGASLFNGDSGGPVLPVVALGSPDGLAIGLGYGRKTGTAPADEESAIVLFSASRIWDFVSEYSSRHPLCGVAPAGGGCAGSVP